MKKNLSRYRRDVLSFFREVGTSCPDVESLEYLLLTAQQNRRWFEKFQAHFLCCESCQRRIRLIGLFYTILDQELAQPHSPAVIKMAQRLAEQPQA
ncbi:MAG: hypothetical protein ONA90_05450 [candidate division KSB1 bacterium]|nr:hypothetical protein [candidate division KSB1 bacterium]